MIAAEMITLHGESSSTNRCHILLTDPTSQRFPMLTSLLYMHGSGLLSLSQIQQASHLSGSFDILWQPILAQSTQLSATDFPPKIISTLATTLETQAASILLELIQKNEVLLSISMPRASAANSFSFKVVQQIAQNATPLNRHTTALISKYISIKPFHESDAICQVGFKQVLPLDQATQEFLLFCTEDKSAIENPISLAGHAHRFSQLRDLTTIEQQTSAIAKHYLNALYHRHDEITLDNDFIRNQSNDKQQLIAQLIYTYAHIKCALPIAANELNALLQACRAEGLHYWHAYLLTYGHIVRAYEPSNDTTLEIQHLQQAQQEFAALGDLVGVSRALQARATISLLQRKFQSASRALNASLAIRQILQEPKGVAKVLNSIAYVHTQADDLNRAIFSHLQAIEQLKATQEHAELAFTENQIAWCHLLKGNYTKAQKFGEQALETMRHFQLKTLSYRTLPDIHAQIGLAYILSGMPSEAEKHLKICETDKVSSSATGEVLRTLLRALIHRHRNEAHLADFSFSCIPDLLTDNSQLDNHIEALYLRVITQCAIEDGDALNARALAKSGQNYCLRHQLPEMGNWFYQHGQ